MPVQLEINGKHPVKVWTDDLDELARSQLENLSSLECVYHHVAAMPDVHGGMGATIGSVIPTINAIIPAACGVDIGCGMCANQLSIRADQLPDNLRGVRGLIEAAVPVGFDQHQKPRASKPVLRKFELGLDAILERHPDITSMTSNIYKKWTSQLGTLGGGNHFIEICLDEDNAVWVMLHSGSRGIGNIIGRHFIQLAKQDMDETHLRNLPDVNLAYLSEGTQYFNDYIDAVWWAQEYAAVNREVMMSLVLGALRESTDLPDFEVLGSAVNCHHNYVSREIHYGQQAFITRKGAISAKAGELGIIPGSMGAKSYIVKGKGNEESFTSSAHGAGRRMSRKRARKEFTVDDLQTQTVGVECRKDEGVLDELPSAYKDIDTVIANQADLVDVVHTLKQIVCVKG